MRGCGEGFLDEVLCVPVSGLSVCTCGLELPRTWAMAAFGSTQPSGEGLVPQWGHLPLAGPLSLCVRECFLSENSNTGTELQGRTGRLHSWGFQKRHMGREGPFFHGLLLIPHSARGFSSTLAH